VRIVDVQVHKVNIPFEAPLRWSGGVEDGWTRCILRMRTDDGLEGIGETQGGTPTMVQIEALKGDFVGEDPFDLERILKKFWWVPFYHGTTGRLAISGLEMCCWDLDGCFELPDGPGLGVQLDEGRLAELEEANRRDGDILIYAHDEEQRRDPPFQGQW
jgi:L-alanine-DL-glutamate epimerase-like enolase superfamily enzyme